MTKIPVTLTVTVNDTTLDVLEISGSEGVSMLFEIEIVARSKDIHQDLDALAGAGATLAFEHGTHTRSIHGVLGGLTQEQTTAESAVYRLWLVPEAWLLTQRVDYRIFQSPSSLGALFAVLLGAVPYSMALSKTIAPRDLYVQYGESDWDFLCRLMEEHGLYYYFEHRAEGCTLVITDYAQSTDVSVAALDFHDDQGALTGAAEVVTSFHFGKRIRPALVTTRAVSFDKPSQPTNEQAGKADSYFEVHSYQPAQSAESRLAALRIRAATGNGAAHTVRLASGSKITLGNHPRSDFDGEYFVTRVEHKGNTASFAAGYACSFECIPASTTYRPEAKTLRPTITGPQAATVVSSGDEIDVDEYGRVLVRMHWDRLGTDDGSGSLTYNACRVPVAQAASGSAYGSMFIPRKGSYVLVEFLDGDPEKPVITGRAFNTLAQYPYSLPANKTISSIRTSITPYQSAAHFHELTFQDSAGSEEIYLRAERQLRVEVTDSDDGEDALREVTVNGDDTELVTGDQVINVVGKRSLLVGALADDEPLSVANNVTVTGDETISVSGDRTVTIGTATANSGSGNQSKTTVYGNESTTIRGVETRRVTLTRSIDVGSGTTPVDDDSAVVIYTQDSSVRGSERAMVSDDQRLVVNGNQGVSIGGSQTIEVSGSRTETIDMDVSQNFGSLTTTVMTGDVSVTSASGEVRIESYTDATKIGGNTIYLSAESNIEIRSATSITFVVGSLTDNGTWYRKITLDADGIYLSNGDVTEKLVGSQVKINC
ncbi:MAG: type VI secretion system tip protein TssI/VgrG [Byssovorax sp.]